MQSMPALLWVRCAHNLGAIASSAGAMQADGKSAGVQAAPVARAAPAPAAAAKQAAAGDRAHLNGAQTHEQAALRNGWGQVLNGFALMAICAMAFSLRLFSVVKYESVIHEFDPYFNYRVTQYLVKEGYYNLWNWFDEFTWYPLGRVVGGTVYPVRARPPPQPSSALVQQCTDTAARCPIYDTLYLRRSLWVSAAISKTGGLHRHVAVADGTETGLRSQW